ncbi:nucleotidyltransferase domain-containing protein [Zobellella sp. An-6]|uniref:nucleotidyltransferase domain-containing protein n=1 Tax=Zobellella sp. An-6 TaxID=3400218 RepID=UPI0040428C55
MTEASYGLGHEAIGRIRSVLAGFPQIERAILCGSRAMGRERPGSDIDLTLVGEDIDQRLLDNLGNRLDDLLLPWQFDLSAYR